MEFHAQLSCISFGCVDLVRTCSAPTSIEHGSRQVARTKEQRFYMLTPTFGSLWLSAWGRRIALNAGDFTIFDNSAPFSISFEKPNHALILQVTPEFIRARLPDAERFYARPMLVDCGLNMTASAMLTSLWTVVERGVPKSAVAGVAKNLLDVVAAAYAVEFGCEAEESSVGNGRRAQIKRHIESNLQDSNLCAQSIAGSLHISPRYLRQLFTTEGETIGGYILRRRLEECSARLTNKLWSNRSVTAIAFAWGFMSAPHFTRAFKQQFGITPTAYRREHAEAPSA